jgi:hypothetical protein
VLIFFDGTRFLLHPTLLEYHIRQVLSNFCKGMAQAIADGKQRALSMSSERLRNHHSHRGRWI